MPMCYIDLAVKNLLTYLSIYYFVLYIIRNIPKYSCNMLPGTKNYLYIYLPYIWSKYSKDVNELSRNLSSISQFSCDGSRNLFQFCVW